jgi:hypothetical protein
MLTLAVVSQKGGAGKTTLTVHLAVAAMRAGEKVAILDTDPQHSASAWARTREDEEPLVVEVDPGEVPEALAAAKRDRDLPSLGLRTRTMQTERVRPRYSRANRRDYLRRREGVRLGDRAERMPDTSAGGRRSPKPVRGSRGPPRDGRAGPPASIRPSRTERPRRPRVRAERNCCRRDCRPLGLRSRAYEKEKLSNAYPEEAVRPERVRQAA